MTISFEKLKARLLTNPKVTCINGLDRLLLPQRAEDAFLIRGIRVSGGSPTRPDGRPSGGSIRM